MPVKTRLESREAFENKRYCRPERLVNRRRSVRRTDKVHQMSGGLCLLATTHLVMTSGEHLLELEPALRPVLTFTCSPQRRIQAFGACTGKWWQHQLGGQQQLHQLFCAMRIIGGQRVTGVSSSRERGDEPEARSSDAAACTVLMALAAELAAGRIRAVRHGSSWLEAVPLPTVRVWHISVECA